LPHSRPPHSDVVYPSAIPFVVTHLVCVGAIWTGVPLQALVLASILYVVRMWAITAGYHRYFSHRTYKTSRAMQFLIAFLGQTSAQRGVIWWAAVHRHHHLHSDTEHDVHSPKHHGFVYSHVTWIFNPSNWEPDYGTVKDLTRYPELVWLDRNTYLPAILLGFGVWLVGGWAMLVVGFFWSTVVLFHCTFFINSLAHVSGSQRYLTGDDSRNNLWLALITLGEGWHNNHHHYQSSTRQGFRWWEIDISFYVLKVMSWFRLVWDLRAPPEEIVRGERPVGRKVVERVANELAGAFNIEGISWAVRKAWDEAHPIEDLSDCVRRASAQVEERLTEMSFPLLPTVPELRDKAEEMFQESHSLDAIVNRTHEILATAVARHLCERAIASG
jgi:stearoyl-CoA desaturase (delta-9 desaturase)